MSVPTIFAQEKVRNLIELQRTESHAEKDPPTIESILILLGLCLGAISIYMLIKHLTNKYLLQKYKEETEMDLRDLAIQKQRLSFLHESILKPMSKFICITLTFIVIFVAIECVVNYFILSRANDFFYQRGGYGVIVLINFPIFLIAAIFIPKFYMDIQHLRKKMRYHSIQTSLSFKAIETIVDQWVQKMTEELQMKVTWKEVRNKKKDRYQDLQIGIEPVGSPYWLPFITQELPFVIHVVLNHQEILFNLIGKDQEYNYRYKYNSEIPTSDYRAHRKKIRSLEAALRGEENYKSSKIHWLLR